MDELKVGALLRDAGDNSIVLRKAEGGRASLSFSASSEEPYQRWFGIEVLDHAKGAVRMQRFERGAVPLLFNHNWDDPIGMVKSASVRNGRLMIDEAELFSTARSAEVERMVNEGLRNVSAPLTGSRWRFQSSRCRPIPLSELDAPPIKRHAPCVWCVQFPPPRPPPLLRKVASWQPKNTPPRAQSRIFK